MTAEILARLKVLEEKVEALGRAVFETGETGYPSPDWYRCQVCGCKRDASVGFVARANLFCGACGDTTGHERVEAEDVVEHLTGGDDLALGKVRAVEADVIVDDDGFPLRVRSSPYLAAETIRIYQEEVPESEREFLALLASKFDQAYLRFREWWRANHGEKR